MRRTPGRTLYRLAVLCALAACPAGVAAQQSGVERIQVGDSVRVHLPGALPIDAAFERWQSDELILRVEGLEGRWPVSVYDLSSLELYTLRTRQESFRHGVILGAVSGVFIGAAAGVLLHSVGVIDDPDAPPAQLLTNGLRGAGLGAIALGLAGGFYFGRNPGYGWVSITLPVGP